jgi:hypothetical protein
MFKPGQLVTVSINDLHYTQDGFATGRIVPDGKFCFHEIVDLHTYPSCNDFRGGTTTVNEGDIATVHKFLGRPWKIRPGDEFEGYDVYEILVHGVVRHAFQQNLKAIKL